ncbi:ATP-binding protein [Streptomyces phaeolivaceus]|uniref:ATP-binding protein n=1 Tax=Streptomyces phaeolivaceus TaxID=2653200 RepID=A0A5P8K3V3_9ACTN|nr:ATP-binding protein [Streptomyces phaeolivaceus]QFQ97821.1 ATP-binding protein [Streptomyces phaeolivaceus]
MVTVSPLGSPSPPCWDYVLRLPRDPRAARVARLTVRAALTTHGMDGLLDVTELLTSELVTSAYRHTYGPSSLRLVALGEGWLRVFVWDASPHIPPAPPLPVPTDGEGGRGLLLVERCADRWGCWPMEGGSLGTGGGKLMWFELGGAEGGVPMRGCLITVVVVA